MSQSIAILRGLGTPPMGTPSPISPTSLPPNEDAMSQRCSLHHPSLFVIGKTRALYNSIIIFTCLQVRFSAFLLDAVPSEKIRPPSGGNSNILAAINFGWHFSWPENILLMDCPSQIYIFRFLKLIANAMENNDNYFKCFSLDIESGI